MIKDLEVIQLRNKNQFVVESKKERYFISYRSVIACYNKEKRTLTLGVDWDYSNTTRKHLYLFINGWCFIPEITERIDMAKNKRKEIEKLIKSKKIRYNQNLK